ncbi:MAG: Mth938-like domain-containing protein [Mariprofundaceae bacterium]
MHIDEYEFGRIVIDGKEYIQDIIIFPDSIQASWWRREGHYLHTEDLAMIIDRPPNVLIIGQGFSGCMRVPDELIETLKAKGMQVHVAHTRDAVALYNRLSGGDQSIAAALHLTC